MARATCVTSTYQEGERSDEHGTVVPCSSPCEVVWRGVCSCVECSALPASCCVWCGVVFVWRSVTVYVVSVRE